MEMSIQELTRKLSVLVRLSVADKQFAWLEKAMVYRIGRQNNLSEEETSALIRLPMPIRTPETADIDQKLAYLIDCIELMKVDLKIRESEVIFIRSIAISLGFKKGIVDFLIQNFNGNIHSARELSGISEFIP
jgi:hypothetical protein